MRALTVAASVLAAGVILANPTATPAKAQGFEYPYCTSGGWATDNICRFYTFEQCMTFVHGLGGSCVRNPRAAHPAAQYPHTINGSTRQRR